MSAPTTAQVYEALAADLGRWFARRAPADRVDDLLQETFVRVHERLPQLRDPERVAPWVYRVARSVLVDQGRREVRQEPLTAEPAVAAGEPLREPDAVVASWLPSLVEALPEPYREAVRASELEGVSQAELARRLALSPSGARTRVQRGRKLLKQQLEACCALAREGGQVVDWTLRGEGCGCGCP
ncbi:MAG: sigma-70 family RNA polymerase sigma factor [Alphaproteobacteria bacterium]|nr:sigma-70 family RNA polymerase sigma factor [Alphaproteobacteria bacterium]